MGRRFSLAVASAALVLACARIDLGPDPFVDAALTTNADAAAADTAASSGVRPPLDGDFFFCRVMPEVVRPSRCASERGCHASDSGLRLLVEAETVAPPTCIDDHPSTPVPASYYTNLARSRAETRATARASDFYWRPLGNDHPERIYAEGSPEAAIVRAWIEGSAP
jgi:hypothetical protein